MGEKRIAAGKILRLNGRPLPIPAWDDDGNVQFESPEDEAKGKIKLKDADPVGLIEYLIMTLPRAIQTPKDPTRVSQMMYALDQHKEGAEHLELTPKVYEWLHGLLNRQIQPSKEDKEREVQAQTYAVSKFGVEARWIVNQLKDIDERKTLKEIAEEEE